MGSFLAVGPALVVGFLAGLFSFRVKARWCPACGAILTCPDHNHAAD
jgi:hypothetical protein